jgi:hypothetical protein
MLTKEVHQIKKIISFTTSRDPSHDARHLSDQSELAAEGSCNRYYKITTSSLFRDFQLHRTDSLLDVVLPYVEDIRHSVSWQGTFKGVLLDVASCEKNNAKYMEFFY